MKTIPVKSQVVNMSTGKVVEERTTHASIMPPAAHLCQTCAVDHPAEAPHNRDSLYYQMVFFGENGRWPTWKDAMAHCAPHIVTVWTQLLENKGVKVDE